jgi:hypothetical protein
MKNIMNINENSPLLDKILKFSLILGILIYLSNCSSNTDTSTNDKEIINPDAKARAREYAEKHLGLKPKKFKMIASNDKLSATEQKRRAREWAEKELNMKFDGDY